MDVRLLFPNEYISAADLKGRDVTLTISKAVPEDLRTEGNQTTKRLVVYFREMEERHQREGKTNKRYVLGNKTTMRVLGKLLGWETEAWGGKRITLYPTTCQAFGQQVDCIRVREQEPATPAPNGNGERKKFLEALSEDSIRGEVGEELARLGVGSLAECSVEQLKAINAAVFNPINS